MESMINGLLDIGIGEKESNVQYNNAFSPGTKFMHDMSEQLKFFIKRKFAEDENYRHLQVIFSGADVPGEGEHKVSSIVPNCTKPVCVDH